MKKSKTHTSGTKVPALLGSALLMACVPSESDLDPGADRDDQTPSTTALCLYDKTGDTARSRCFSAEQVTAAGGVLAISDFSKESEWLDDGVGSYEVADGFGVQLFKNAAFEDELHTSFAESGGSTVELAPAERNHASSMKIYDRENYLFDVTDEQIASTHASARSIFGACDGDPSWLNASHTPPSDPVGEGPLDIICKFHRFAWENMISVIRPAGGSSTPIFHGWMRPEQIFVSEGAPAAWGTPNSRVYADTVQAGSNRPLLDRHAQPIYYEKLVNKTLYDAIVSNQFFDESCIEKADAIGDERDYLPPGSSLIKIAWKVLDPGEKANYFTVENVQVTKSDGSLEVADLGIVGFHLVLKTPRHPEWIWATFDHTDNAPSCDDLGAKSPSGRAWTFYDADRAGALNTYVAGKPTQVCRETPYGSGFLAKAGLTNISDIVELNESVLPMLNNDPNLAVWKNYSLTGTSWTQSLVPTSTAGIVPPRWWNEIGGSSLLSNVTLETYVQGKTDIFHPSRETSCFSCHYYHPEDEVRPTPLHISHIFDDAFDLHRCP